MIFSAFWGGFDVKFKVRFSLSFLVFFLLLFYCLFLFYIIKEFAFEFYGIGLLMRIKTIILAMIMFCNVFFPKDPMALIVSMSVVALP